MKKGNLHLIYVNEIKVYCLYHQVKFNILQPILRLEQYFYFSIVE